MLALALGDTLPAQAPKGGVAAPGPAGQATGGPARAGEQRGPRPGQGWENALGMRFLPVPGLAVLFGVWDTRVQDFAAFVKDTGYDATAGMYSIGGDRWKKLGNTWRSPGFPQEPTHPVCGVSWNDATAFCRWLTEKERREGRLGADQEYRLPTDAEWSVAAGLEEPAGGTPQSKDAQIKGVYAWGREWPPPPGAGNFAGTEARDDDWPADWGVIEGYNDGYPRTSPVGRFRANRYGLFDMSGNVCQWCADFYNGRNGLRVARGGAFCFSGSFYLLLSYRYCLKPDRRSDQCGFRCVLVASASEESGSLTGAKADRVPK